MHGREAYDEKLVTSHKVPYDFICGWRQHGSFLQLRLFYLNLVAALSHFFIFIFRFSQDFKSITFIFLSRNPIENHLLHYIMVDGWAGIVREILMLKPLIIYHLKNLFLVKTEKKREEATDLGSLGFNTREPRIQLYFQHY